MANEANVTGILEIYDRNEFEKIVTHINTLKENFFNITINETFLNNRGSILIPFAKCFRSDEDDNEFLCEKIIEIINEFSFLDMFAIELYVNSSYLKNRCYRVLVGNGGHEKIEKFSLVFSVIE